MNQQLHEPVLSDLEELSEVPLLLITISSEYDYYFYYNFWFSSINFLPNLIPIPDYISIFPSSIRASIRAATYLNMLSTLILSLAEHSQNNKLLSLANFNPSSTETSLYESRSILFPHTIPYMYSLDNSLTSSIHFYKLLKLSRFVIS